MGKRSRLLDEYYSIYYKTVCAGCGKTVRSKIKLSPETVNCGGYDMWSLGWPDSWLQVAYDETTGQHYLFFHSRDCYCKWLERQERFEEVEKFKGGIWIG